jgi:hypothetical protein
MLWIYWDTAWSIIFGGIMFATIVTHAEADFIEVAHERHASFRNRQW